jgi:alkylglycerol monooxygenase
VEPWIALWRASAQARGLDRLRVWIKGPDWLPGGGRYAVQEIVRKNQQKHDPQVSRRLALYVAANLVLAIGGTTWLLFTQWTLGVRWQMALAALLLSTMLAWGGLLERRRWAVPLEAVRLATFGAVAIAWIR